MYVRYRGHCLEPFTVCQTHLSLFRRELRANRCARTYTNIFSHIQSFFFLFEKSWIGSLAYDVIRIWRDVMK